MRQPTPIATPTRTRQAKMNKGVCGELSFDSTDDGMICVEDPSSETLKWICQ